MIAIPLTAESVGRNRNACTALAGCLDNLRSSSLAKELRTSVNQHDYGSTGKCVKRIYKETGPQKARAVLESPFRQGAATGWDLVNLMTAAAREIHKEDWPKKEDAELAAGRLGRTLIAERAALSP